ncbi:peptidoglycan recognition protein [Holotrichia oblita]|uniref:Peptidoglycan recognition protein n=1 Tax=Holotrichia oblita TaxID=644536 RepID=A0ACB9TCB0_HOLOL|nr:peptidoglycan recognition protein [Holotrichia oblita]
MYGTILVQQFDLLNIGEDGHIYEGVGWDRAANNTPQYDRDSLHIAVMGDYTSWLPGTKALNVMKELVKCAVSKEAVYTNYQLLGHRQLQSRDCPGSRLQQEIKQWPHWGLY